METFNRTSKNKIMISKKIMKHLHDINLMVIELINKNYGHVSDMPTEPFWYEVKINGDGSLRLGFQAHIIDNSTERTHIQCSNNKDFETVKTMLKQRLEL